MHFMVYIKNFEFDIVRLVHSWKININKKLCTFKSLSSCIERQKNHSYVVCEWLIGGKSQDENIMVKIIIKS